VTDESGKERFHHFVVVVFGLGPAGQLLARVMRPILTYLMLRGIRNTMYIDNGRTVGATKSKADGNYALTLKMFVGGGFTVAAEKSDKIGDSLQEKEYLGFVIDTRSMTVHIPKLKLERILSQLTIFLKAKQYKVRDVASMVEKLIALEPALGRSVLIGTRLATIEIVAATDISDAAKRRLNPWKRKITLETDTIGALEDILGSMEGWNRWPICVWHTGITLSSVLPFEATASLDRKIPARKVHNRKAVMASNALDFAVASYSVEGLPEFTFLSELTLKARTESLSCPELLAILRTLQHLVVSDISRQSPPGQITLWWLTDNQNVKKFLAKGSGILRITKLVLEVLKTDRGLLFDLQPVWVSRENPFLLKAVAISKGIDTDNWAVTAEDCAHLSSLYGPFSVNLFASSENAKCSRFYSRSFESGSLGVDAFAQNWEFECAYAAPPVTLEMHTIRKAALVDLSGVLIIPL
jgi:hypothetical protein